MEHSRARTIHFRLAILWLAILSLSSFWLAERGTSGLASITVIPQAPREGEPVIAIFKLGNPSSEEAVTAYELYANGRLLIEGTTVIAPSSDRTYKYAYANPLPLGERLNFTVATRSELGSYQGTFSSPPYPPQVWSSFVSFASFSTSVMSSMSTMTYYENTFGTHTGINVGIVISAVLIVLLLIAELTAPMVEARAGRALAKVRATFSTVTWILFIIFTGIVYTRVVMILASQ